MSIEKYLRNQAGNIWNLQKRALKHKIRLREETITERLLLDIAHDADPKVLTVRLSTPAEEARNGSDWEWHFSSQDCDIGFRVQAKKLFLNPSKDGRYDSFSPASNQTRSLIKEAYADGCNPIFVFYNHPGVKNYSLMTAQAPYTSESIWGCAVAHAAPTMLARDSKLDRILPYCAPWHQFFSGDSCNIEKLMKNISAPSIIYRSRPDWTYQLTENIDLAEYFRSRKLAGVAYFEALENLTEADFEMKSRRP